MNGIYGNGIQMTEKVLDLLWGRQNVTLNNIANVDTPGFKSQYITFEEELERKVKKCFSREETGSAYSGGGFFCASGLKNNLDRRNPSGWQQRGYGSGDGRAHV